ncbi:MAG: hypothetical protein CVV45_05555 [Spirochaetae bacterium HGW-Spirochaetae-10]|nr:MAG: hypothetical protein CVV45_05555 [Spirochaetae bacterium HGW-Spirochaetae-10]
MNVPIITGTSQKEIQTGWIPKRVDIQFKQRSQTTIGKMNPAIAEEAGASLAIVQPARITISLRESIKVSIGLPHQVSRRQQKQDGLY